MTPVYAHLLTSKTPTLPLVIDEVGSLEILRNYSGIHVTTIEECFELPGVHIYQKDEDKQSLSIVQIRRAISDMSEKPYGGKEVYIFRDFDTASLEAMNASLKMLEEPPSYAIILLIVSNPENLIDTIRSRTLTYFAPRKYDPLPIEWDEAIEDMKRGDPRGLISLHSSQKAEVTLYFTLLSRLTEFAGRDGLMHISRAFESLMSINETPRNIIDRLILSDIHK